MTVRVGMAGCGIGGLAAAAFLTRAGHSVTLFERFAAAAPVGSGLVLQPVGLAVLETLGLAGPAAALGHPIRALKGEDARTRRPVLDVQYGAGRAGLGIHRAALFALLHAAAGADIRTGAEIVAADPEAGTFTDAAGDRHGPFDLLIDATGSGSPLAPHPGRALSYGALWATVPWPLPGPLPEHLRQTYQGARRMAGILPVGRLPGGDDLLAAIFWSLPQSAYGQWRGTSLAAWKAEAAAFWPDFAPFLESLSDHEDLTMARYRHRTLRDPVRGRLLHLGDAWHATSPQLGQGANMALLDALALAGALERQGDVPAALRDFRSARVAHVRLYQALSLILTPMYQSDSRWLPVLRDALLAPAQRLPGLRWLLGRLVSGDLVPPIR